MLVSISILGILYVMAMVFLALFKRCRKFALWTGLVAVAVTLTAMTITGSRINADARAAGYDSADDQRDAQRAGITDPAMWRAQREAHLKTWAAEKKQKGAAVKEMKDQESAQADAICHKDFNCWSNKFNRAATKVCAPQVERAAKNNFEWTDSFTSPKFPRATINDNGASITYVGDAIKMQNGFGAWIIMTYECDFDTKASRAIAVRVNPGQLTN
ncbi:hypothetical protein HX900_28010 [Rhizobium sp. WYCCWR 11290]|uniref:Uncharacterized protein n=1 Tax=Rhizobium changzhiense TaxID=2692317 RepID=A0A7Z0UFL9_9HYPH|nr:hypothetical protein [Rhizobium changzhiense]NZD64924.1 hypothetical protein [Rhizobium changzhiense]